MNPVALTIEFALAIGLMVCVTRALAALKYGDPYADEDDEDEDDFSDEEPTRRIPYVSLDDTARMWRASQGAAEVGQ